MCIRDRVWRWPRQRHDHTESCTVAVYSNSIFRRCRCSNGLTGYMSNSGVGVERQRHTHPLAQPRGLYI
eukprot:2208936-Alexandrium_andersonii.AAC.1